MVAGTGFRFAAPAGWAIQHGLSAVTAAQATRSSECRRNPLARPYAPALFTKVARELKVRMSALAAQSGGKIDSTGVATADGIKAHVWRITTGDDLDEYTFVLRGRREYQLLCRRPAGSGDAACRQLVSTFRLT